MHQKKMIPPLKRKKNTKNHTIFEVKVQDVPSASLDLPLLVPVAAQRPATGFFLKKTPRLFHKNHRLGNLRAPQDFLTQESSLSNHPHYPHHPHHPTCGAACTSVPTPAIYCGSPSTCMAWNCAPQCLGDMATWQHVSRKTKSFKGVTCVIGRVKPFGGGSSNTFASLNMMLNR